VKLSFIHADFEGSIDLVLAIKDASWPLVANEWKTRPRSGEYLLHLSMMTPLGLGRGNRGVPALESTLSISDKNPIHITYIFLQVEDVFKF